MVEVVAVLLIKWVNNLCKWLAMFLIESSHFANKHWCNYCVLITNISTCKVAVALFKAEYISVLFAFLFKVEDNFTDVLKTCKNIFKFTAVLFTKLVDKFCCNDCLNQNRLFGKCAVCLAWRKNIICKHNAVFITWNKAVAAIVIFNRNTYTVCVRVCCKKKVGLYFFAKFNTFLESLFNFRVWVRASGKVAVRKLLLRYNCNFFNTDFLKNFSYKFVACTVEWGINYL